MFKVALNWGQTPFNFLPRVHPINDPAPSPSPLTHFSPIGGKDCPINEGHKPRLLSERNGDGTIVGVQDQQHVSWPHFIEYASQQFCVQTPRVPHFKDQDARVSV